MSHAIYRSMVKREYENRVEVRKTEADEASVFQFICC